LVNKLNLTIFAPFATISPMLSIRLQRVGRKHDPSFRVVLTDSKNGPQSGKFLEVLGSYDARKGTPVLNKERILELVSKGAQPSPTVHNLMVRTKVHKAPKIDVSQKPEVVAAPVAATPAPAAPAPVETPTEETATPAEETPAA
jgi:small subunit ribosomal protein S16